MEEHLSGVHQELERLQKQHAEVIEKLEKANEHIQGQLSESRGQYERLLSEHDHLLRERNHAVGEVQELRQKSAVVDGLLGDRSNKQVKLCFSKFCLPFC